MIPRVRVKRVLKRAAGFASAATVPFMHRNNGPQVCILVYHRIAEPSFTDGHLDSWSVSPQRFGEQMEALAERAELISLRDVLTRIGSAPQVKPLVCVTFDDGYKNFFSRALPVLQRFSIPAALFVVTKFVDEPGPMPFDRWGRKHKHRIGPDAWRPVGWQDLECGAKSGLLTIGAHSHQHLNGRDCTAAELRDEAQRSRSILRERLGSDHAWAYAYPYGSTRLGQASRAYVDAVRSAGYEMALSTNLGLVSAGCDPLCLPRVEVHGVDSPAMLRAKVQGALAPHHLLDRLRQARRTG